MSFQAMAWAVDLPLPTREKFVLLMLANYAGNELGEARPSTARLARDTGMARSTVVEALRALESLGALRVQHRSEAGVNLPNFYFLNLGWTPAATQIKGYPAAGQPVDDDGVVRQPDEGLSAGRTGGYPAAGHKPINEPINEPVSKEEGGGAPPSPKQKPKASIAERVSFDYEAGVFLGLKNDHHSRWTQAFPAINTTQEVAKAAAWAHANPANRKSNWLSFLTRWMSRAQDRAPTAGHSGARSYGQQRPSVTDERAEWLARATGRTQPPGEPDPPDYIDG